MPLMSIFAPPDDRTARDIRELAAVVRCFDRNDGRSFFLPDTDPSGRKWRELTDTELREIAGWCMLPEYHERLALENRYRAGELDFDPMFATAPGTQYLPCHT